MMATCADFDDSSHDQELDVIGKVTRAHFNIIIVIHNILLSGYITH